MKPYRTAHLLVGKDAKRIKELFQLPSVTKVSAAVLHTEHYKGVRNFLSVDDLLNSNILKLHKLYYDRKDLPLDTKTTLNVMVHYSEEWWEANLRKRKENKNQFRSRINDSYGKR